MKNLDPEQNHQIYNEMLANSITPVFRQTDADRMAEMTAHGGNDRSQFERLRQNAIGFSGPTTAVEGAFKKLAPGLWEIWAAWKELQ